MKMAILGTGCPKCDLLAKNAEAAIRELGVDCQLEKVTDVTEIVSYGVMLTPALAIDGNVVSTGKVLEAEEIKKYLGDQTE